MGEKEGQEFESLEQEVFKALDHQKRYPQIRWWKEGNYLHWDSECKQNTW